MRIAYICADRGIELSGSAGSSVHTTELIRALVEQGASVDAFLSVAASDVNSVALPCPVFDIASDPILEQVRGRTAKALRDRSKDATSAAEVYSLLLNPSLMAALDENAGEVDLVYERHSLWSLAGLCFARRRGIPYFLELNAPLSVQQQEYRELELVEAATTIEDVVLSSADLVLATTAALVEHAHERGASRRSTRVLPCGVSADMFGDPTKRPKQNPDRFVLGFVGSLKPWHGIEILAAADVIRGRRVTTIPRCRLDAEFSGATYVAESLVIDGNLYCCRFKRECSAWMKAFAARLAEEV